MEFIGYTEQRDSLVRDFVNNAIQSRYWIYKPAEKRWFTPEEFYEKIQSKKLDLRDGWHDDYKIMNPQRGIDAAEIRCKELTDKRVAFQQKVLEYFLSKPK